MFAREAFFAFFLDFAQRSSIAIRQRDDKVTNMAVTMSKGSGLLLLESSVCSGEVSGSWFEFTPKKYPRGGSIGPAGAMFGFPLLKDRSSKDLALSM